MTPISCSPMHKAVDLELHFFHYFTLGQQPSIKIMFKDYFIFIVVTSSLIVWKKALSTLFSVPLVFERGQVIALPPSHSGIFDEKLSHGQKIMCYKSLKKVENIFPAKFNQTWLSFRYISLSKHKPCQKFLKSNKGFRRYRGSNGFC